MSDVRVTNVGSERVDELEPLWAAMHAHHASLARLPPTRPFSDSWRRRRDQYWRWLEEGQAQLLIAERGGSAVGYAMLRFDAGPPTWDVGDHVAELESLSVAGGERGAGIGAMLVAAAREAARQAGAERLFVSVAHANVAALRFYERHGFEPFYVQLIERSSSERETRRLD